MLRKGGRTPFTRDMGGFIVHPNMPGLLKPWGRDHGHGPLALVVESILHPGRQIAMHEHRNDEIISWVPDGVMRHDDKAGGRLTIDAGHLMVMNAGRGFWHSEETFATDPPLRMLQILIRPRAEDLEPGVQHGPIPPAQPNVWRHLCGPEDSGAPFFVRNAVDLYDISLQAGAQAGFPQKAGRDLYFLVFSGSIQVDRTTFGEGEQGLLTGGGLLQLQADEPAVVVAFLLDPHAPATRSGTVGDSAKIPSALVIRAVAPWFRLRRTLRQLSGRQAG